MSLPQFLTQTALHPSFKNDILNPHLIYDYQSTDAHGNPEKWRYELWFFSEDRIVYAIHGGPMKGRQGYQACAYQCIRPGEVWQCNFLEETGTFVSLV
ncbi:Phenolic acid decarboxylase padC [Mycena chlorophos]|uniref:Phenolic acid decarboxylase padC n=1 Tax=Mycena chlorophos TaxID=658473 RepID=A0A8H6TK43_MYCCL|nr:Phenolic acid decarboxylase padC [Mycena chlorophos]